MIAFYRSFLTCGYDVYLLLDSESPVTECGGVRIVSIADHEAAANGYFDFTPIFKKPSRVVAWDKALYFFNRIARQYSHVWFFEDDVFIPTPGIIQQLDMRHAHADIVSRDNILNATGELHSWYWWKFIPRDLFPPPWSHSLVCAARLSRRLLACLDELVIHSGDWLHVDTAPKHTQVFRAPFIEFIFHLLALHNRMEIVTPRELAHITWRRDWQPEEISPRHLTHPVKDFEEHAEIRQRITRIGGMTQRAIHILP